MIWSRKAPQTPGTKRVGLDLTASRARAVAVSGDRGRVLPLAAPAEDLPLVVGLDGRYPTVGPAALAAVRFRPHLVAVNALAQLGQKTEWRGPRLTLTPESAVTAAFEAMSKTLAGDAESVAFALPPYLSAAQVKSVLTLATKAKLPVRTSAVAPLAVAADRADRLLSAKPTTDAERPDWVVPLRPTAAGPGSVVIVDADDHALTAAVVAVSPADVRLTGGGSWPKAAARRWSDRLIDAVADRCVRVCRRDPRDSAAAEQAIFDQLPAAMIAAAGGKPAAVTVRTDHWYQDLTFRPEELNSFCASIARPAADGIRELAAGVGSAPPRAVWLTAAAGTLPGLAAAIHAAMPESTSVAVLSADAVAMAIGRLAARELPAGHWDSAIGLPPQPSAAKSSVIGH
jgi:hypothetical protein